MDKYFCVFQKVGSLAPTRISFEAKHPGDAIIKMMETAGVDNTISLEQAEILKCIRSQDGKPAYIPVFVKEKNDYKGRAIMQQAVAPTSSPPQPAPAAAATKEEDVYKKPYTVEVL